MKDDELGETLIEVVSNAGGKDLMLEAAEFSLDAALESGVVKDIPVVGTVAKLFSIARAWQGHLFAKKVQRFITELGKVTADDKREFLAGVAQDPKQRERLGETLAVLLDRLDDMEKAPLLARAFAGYVREDYDFSTFQRLAAAIDRCLVFDLSTLTRIKKPAGLEGYVGDVLVSAGLATVTAFPTIRATDTKTNYLLSPLGELFLQVVVKGLPREDE